MDDLASDEDRLLGLISDPNNCVSAGAGASACFETGMGFYVDLLEGGYVKELGVGLYLVELHTEQVLLHVVRSDPFALFASKSMTRPAA